MKGQEVAEQINPTRLLSFDKFDWNVFENLSDWLKDKIKSSEEYKLLVEPQVVNAQPSNNETDDLPF
jgi:hypothetical protein